MADSTLNAAVTAVTGATRAARPDNGRANAPQSSGDVIPATGNNPPPERSAADLKLAVEQINRYLADSKRNLVFSVDEGSGRTVIRVINPETSEVIREIPPEETLVLARYGDRILDTLA